MLTQQSDRGTTGGLTAVGVGAREFEAHGDSAAGQQLNRLALDWARSNAPSTVSLPWERLDGQLWLFAGALDSAATHFTRALRDTSVNAIATVGYLAMIAARQNNGARARGERVPFKAGRAGRAGTNVHALELTSSGHA